MLALEMADRIRFEKAERKRVPKQFNLYFRRCARARARVWGRVWGGGCPCGLAVAFWS